MCALCTLQNAWKTFVFSVVVIAYNWRVCLPAYHCTPLATLKKKSSVTDSPYNAHLHFSISVSASDHYRYSQLRCMCKGCDVEMF